MEAAEVETRALFDLGHSMAGKLLAKFRCPYEALPRLEVWIAAVGPQLSSDEYGKRGEQIWIHRSAKVAPNVSLTGPLIVCTSVEFRHCVCFRGNALIGAGSATGNFYEFKNLLLLDSVEAPHYSYVGDSVLGYHARIGTGSIMSNIKPDRGSIVIRTDNGAVETGLRKIGVTPDDCIEVGYGTVLNPGSVAGKNTMIYPLASVRDPVSVNSIVKNAENIIIRQN